MPVWTNADTQKQQQVLQVRTLGEFSVRRGDVVLTDGSKRTQRIWTLFKYLVTYRNKRIPPEDFFDAIWEDEDTQYPGRALQNLVYRLRNALQDGTGDGEYILNVQGCYILNSRAPHELDVEQMESLVQAAQEADRLGLPEALNRYLEAVALYGGDYLPELAYVDWVIPVRNYYKRLYMDAVMRTIQLLREQRRFADVVTLCERAITMEPYEEILHARLMETFLDIGKTAQAQAHYEYVTGMLYRELGVKPSAELKDVYRRMHERLEDIQMDLDAIQETILERGNSGDAFLCDAETFKALYRLEARRILRSGKTVYLGLFTLVTPQYAVPESAVLSVAMEQLSRILLASLRRSDVVARWSESQMLVLMQSLTYEDGEMVVNRILRRFEQAHIAGGVMVRSKVQPLDITLTPEYANTLSSSG